MKSLLVSGCLVLAGCCPALAFNCAKPVVIHQVSCPINAAPLTPRDPPAFAGDVYRDLAEHSLKQKAYGLACESDKAAVKVQLDAITSVSPAETPR